MGAHIFFVFLGVTFNETLEADYAVTEWVWSLLKIFKIQHYKQRQSDLLKFSSLGTVF